MKTDTNYKRKQRTKEYDPGKIQCLECGGWYWKVGGHVTQAHGMTAREYKELHNLEVSRGITPPHLRKEWRENALRNNMDKQLNKVGKRTRFKAGHNVGRYKRSPQTIEKLLKSKEKRKLKATRECMRCGWTQRDAYRERMKCCVYGDCYGYHLWGDQENT